MQAVRCIKCGETRWSLFTGSVEQPCQLCGGETVAERRRPGRGPRRILVERRKQVLGGGPRRRQPI